MFIARCLVLVALSGLLAALTVATAADAVKQKESGVSGTVISVEPDKVKKGEGTITIVVGAAKKKDAAPAPGDKKAYTYNKDTTYWKSEGKNTVAALLSEVVKDARVTIIPKGGPTGTVADKVTILAGKNK